MEERFCSCGSPLTEDKNTYGNLGDEHCFECYLKTKDTTINKPILYLVDFSDSKEKEYDSLKVKHKLALMVLAETFSELKAVEAKYKEQLAVINNIEKSMEPVLAAIDRKMLFGGIPSLLYSVDPHEDRTLTNLETTIKNREPLAVVPA